MAFKVSTFGDGGEILTDYQQMYDIILLDIEMPRVNGMEAAEQIRRQDADVVLMFITNMASYAIRGYEVGALDFVMKPINYYTFSMKLTRALKRVKQKEQQQILISVSDGVKKFGVNQIYYVEVQSRMLHYHTDEGEYVVRGTMQSVEQMLAPYPFVKCNHWYIDTIIFMVCYAIGYGAYYSTADMPIPMVADCSDYETFRSGKYVPGIMGTLFSLVDKLVSSLGSTIVGMAVMVIGIKTLPDTNTPYMPGMKWVVIILFCILPMAAWVLTQYAMHRYSLSGEKMKEIQAVNAVRKEAVAGGMSLEEAMDKWKSLEDISSKK